MGSTSGMDDQGFWPLDRAVLQLHQQHAFVVKLRRRAEAGVGDGTEIGQNGDDLPEPFLTGGQRRKHLVIGTERAGKYKTHPQFFFVHCTRSPKI